MKHKSSGMFNDQTPVALPHMPPLNPGTRIEKRQLQNLRVAGKGKTKKGTQHITMVQNCKRCNSHLTRLKRCHLSSSLPGLAQRSVGLDGRPCTYAGNTIRTHKHPEREASPHARYNQRVYTNEYNAYKIHPDRTSARRGKLASGSTARCNEALPIKRSDCGQPHGRTALRSAYPGGIGHGFRRHPLPGANVVLFPAIHGVSPGNEKAVVVYGTGDARREDAKSKPHRQIFQVSTRVRGSLFR